jgi:Protein of unknown function (DUF3800)
MMPSINVFGDESESPQHFVMTCAFASPKTWSDVQHDWTQLLARDRLDELKAHDCVQGSDAFTNVSNEQRQRLYRDYLAIVQRHRVHAASMFIDTPVMPTFASIFGPPFTKAWPLAFAQLIPLVAKRCPPAATIDFVFDKQDEFEAKAREGFKSFKSYSPRAAPTLSAQLGTLEFQDSKLQIGLQVADLVAYEVRLRMRIERPPRKSWEFAVKQMSSTVIGVFDQQVADRYVIANKLLRERGQKISTLTSEELASLRAALPELPPSRSPDELVGTYATYLEQVPVPSTLDDKNG